MAKSLSADPEFLKPGHGNHSAQKIVSLWVAVCACAGINPNHKAARMDWVQQHASDVEGAAGEALQCLMERYTFAEHAAQGGELKTVGPDHKVSLGAFAAFAQQAGWVLPTDFTMEKPNARETATPAPSAAQEPQDAPVEDVGASGDVNWTLVKPQRFQGYTMPLYNFLKAAHLAGRTRPTAREVLEAWREKTPPEVAKVMPASFDYYDAKGDTKEADLNAIRKAIDRMTRQLA